MTDNTIAGELAPSASRTAILVVENDIITRTAISDELRDHGYSVIEAASAGEALSVLQSPTRVDLVLTDMKLPGSLDGAALVRQIRAQLPFMKVVMVAVQPPGPDALKLLDGYLPKPIAPSRLAIFVQTLLPSHTPADASP
jgi:two-component system, response regulator PdtaR